MITLIMNHRTVPAYRHGFLVDRTNWITTRTPLYYLDLGVPNETLFGEHFKKVFPDNKLETGELNSCTLRKEQRFHLDDIGVGFEGRKDSNSFYPYAMVTDREVDRIGMTLFLDFLINFKGDCLSLTYGVFAERFVNLAKLIGYRQWRDRAVFPRPHKPFKHVLVDGVFNHVYPWILKGIYEKQSEHPLLLKKFWDELCITDQNRLNLFLEVPDAKLLKFILEEGNRLKFDWGLNNGGKEMTEYVIIDYMNKNRFELATLLLDFGFALGEMDPEDADKTCCTLRNPLTHTFVKYSSKGFIPNGSMVRFLVRCYENFTNQIEFSAFTKVYLKLSFMSPLAPLPPSIVRNILNEALASHTATVENMMTRYEALYDVHSSDDSSNGVTPQKLSHLSRCVIRDRLAANYQLPTGIADSPLPNLLKRFLKLDF